MADGQPIPRHEQLHVPLGIPGVLQHALGVHSLLRPLRQLGRVFGGFSGAERQWGCEGVQEVQVRLDHANVLGATNFETLGWNQVGRTAGDRRHMVLLFEVVRLCEIQGGYGMASLTSSTYWWSWVSKRLARHL